MTKVGCVLFLADGMMPETNLNIYEDAQCIIMDSPDLRNKFDSDTLESLGDMSENYDTNGDGDA